MTDPSGRIEQISDTAHWVALYRAMESERPDAHFRDPFARRLAGERGEQIVRTMKGARALSWPMVVRTAVMDELITRAVERDGADTVLNLAAGLDARPYRMKLPAALRWFEVDLPHVIAYKQQVLGGEKPLCALERVALDLTDEARRRELFARIGDSSRRVVIVTEGLLVYLTPEQVRSLAADLARPPSYRGWILDIASPQLLKMMQKRMGKELSAAHSEMKFAPAEVTRFFEPTGWKEAEYRSTWEESHRLKREMAFAWVWRFLGRFASARRREEFKRFSGIVRMEKIGG